MTEEGLVLAVPSKGRLEEETRRVFGEQRLPIARPGGARYPGCDDPGVSSQALNLGGRFSRKERPPSRASGW